MLLAEAAVASPSKIRHRIVDDLGGPASFDLLGEGWGVGCEDGVEGWESAGWGGKRNETPAHSPKNDTRLETRSTAPFTPSTQ